jgi:hypothetical protein
MKDFNGVDIVVGDKIAYAGRKGSDLWLSNAVVLGINEYYNIRVLPSHSLKAVTLKNLHTVAVLGR